MNRIKELRQKNNLTLRGLGKEINMSSSRISQYETGKREPKLETWNKLAEYFNVPTSYLMGLSDDDKTVIKKISSEDLLQELINRKVLEPIEVGLYKEFELKRKYKNRDKAINFEGVFLLHNVN